MLLNKTSNAPALAGAVLLASTLGSGAVIAETVSDRIEIERESELFLRRGEGAVTQLDLDVYLARMPQHHRAAFISSPERIGNVLEELITPRQLAAEARREAPGVVADPLFQAQMYQAAVVQIAERYMTHIWTQERLDDYGSQARELYLVRKDLLRLPQQADFTHVLIRSAGTRGELDAMKSIFNLYELLAEGRPLSELAADYSEDPQAENNSGRYEGVDINSLDEAVAEMVRELPPGEISQPFRSELGWHIVELHQRYRPEIESFDQVRERALEIAEQRHRSAVSERILRRLSQQENEFQPGAVEALMKRYEASEQDLEKLKSDIASRLGYGKRE